MRGRVPQQVGMEADDPGARGAVSEGLMQPVVGELPAPVPQPQRGRPSEPVGGPETTVAVDRVGCLGAERDRATLAALAACLLYTSDAADE